MKRKVWVPALLLVAAAVVWAQAQERKGSDIKDHEGLLREIHAGMSAALKQGSPCNTTKGSIFFGQLLSSATSFSSCATPFTQGVVYVDFWALQVPTGHTVMIQATSSQEYLATIQDSGSGTILASTLTCGFTQSNCSFTYTVQLGGTLVVGFGSINNVGPYTLLVTDVTGGAPTPTPPPAATPTPPPQSGCYTSATQGCLNQRYTVSVRWDTSDGRSGSGNVIPLTSDTASFWFFSADNYELMVKVLDGHAINGHTWVFYGALSNVHYLITVTDTATGIVKVYENPQNTLASVGDTSAF
jgi:hypothetical protein